MGRRKQESARGSSGREGSAAEHEGGDGVAGRRSRRFTPEERRKAVEAYAKSGLTLSAFAPTWNVSAQALGNWVRRQAASGGKGLEGAKRKARPKVAPAVRAEVAAVQRRFPTFGLTKLGHFLARFSGIRVAKSTVRRVRAEEGLPAAVPPPKKRRRKPPPNRFERSRPGELWQTDITYLSVPWQRTPLYLIAFLDDHSRYVVGHGLFTHQRADIAVDVLKEAIGRFGRPKELLSDQGRQYYAWRGKTAFQKLLAAEGIAHVVARAHHPQTVGKTERFWATLKSELWARIHPGDLAEARERVAHFVAHHNHQRPHQSLDGLVPADRFFGAADAVKAAIERSIAKNELSLALEERIRKPVYLVGQIDGRTVSLHGEAGRLIVQTPDGTRQEIEAKDLGGMPTKEVARESGDEGSGDDGSLGGIARGAPEGPGGGDASAAPDGDEAGEVPGAEEDADRGAGLVGGGDAGGAEEGARHGGGDPAGVVREGDAGGGGEGAVPLAASVLAALAAGGGGARGGSAAPAEVSGAGEAPRDAGGGERGGAQEENRGA